MFPNINENMKSPMTRREALKRMGAFAALLSLELTGVSALTSCSNKKARRIIFFFTATGNSLFVAKMLSDEILSIPQELKKNDLVYEADEIGFVFPDYAASAPLIVREFISKAVFRAPYIFSVITYGNFAANVCEWWNKFANEQGLPQQYIKSLMMVDNYLPVFDMNEQITIDKHTDENLATIIQEVAAHEEYIEKGDLGRFSEEGLERLRASHFPMTAQQLIDVNHDKCISCGICTRVCPHGNLKLSSEGVIADGSCEFCLACVHNCTQKALSLKSRMEGFPGERNPEARYRHPEISINEIVRANQQRI